MLVTEENTAFSAENARNFLKILVEGGFFFGKIIGKINIVVLIPEEEFLVKNHKSRIINFV